MNCLEFRRELASDPQSADAPFVRHRHECARCAEAYARAHAFEDTLRRALTLDAPPQLAEAILLAQATRERRQRARYRRGGLLALAASLVLAAGIGMRVQANPLGELAVEHLREEASVLSETTPLDSASVREAFTTRGIKLHTVPDGISFVGCCPMDRYLTVHLVMPGEHGPITVIYVVDQRARGRDDFQRDGWRGRSVPVGSGTLILLARDSDQFDRIENLWRSALVGA